MGGGLQPVCCPIIAGERVASLLNGPKLLSWWPSTCCHFHTNGPSLSSLWNAEMRSNWLDLHEWKVLASKDFLSASFPSQTTVIDPL
eukprot:13770879-Ditylum_brightwellii.AAC.1